MTKRAKQLAVCGLILAALALITIFALREKANVYKCVIGNRHLLNNLVLNIKTGRFITRNQAYSTNAPYVSLRPPGSIASKNRRRFWEFLTGPKNNYIVLLYVGNVDCQYAPANCQYAPAKRLGRPLRDYWDDTSTQDWPSIPQRKTSSYVFTVTPDQHHYPILFKTFDGTTGVLKITKVEQGNNTHLQYKILEPADYVPPPQAVPTSPEPFAVTLPNGTRIELVAITYSPSADNPWWKPNGEELHRAPYLNKRKRFRSSRPDRTAYEIAYRVTNADSADGRASFAVDAERAGLGTNTPEDEFGRMVRDVQAEAISLDDTVTSTTLLFGITPNPWQTILTAKQDGASRQYDSNFISISQPQIADGKIKIDFTLSLTKARDYRTRFVAVDYSGKVHNLEKYDEDMTDLKPHSLRRRRHTFLIDDLTLSAIKEFRFDVCRRQWVKFKNISLRPGKDAGFKIEVPNPDPPP
jgi:hypothetical protein